MANDSPLTKVSGLKHNLSLHTPNSAHSEQRVPGIQSSRGLRPPGTAFPGQPYTGSGPTEREYAVSTR